MPWQGSDSDVVTLCRDPRSRAHVALVIKVTDYDPPRWVAGRLGTAHMAMADWEAAVAALQAGLALDAGSSDMVSMACMPSSGIMPASMVCHV